MNVQLAHAIPGRIRLKVPQIRTDPDAAAEVRRRIASLGDVREVNVNTASGSVVLRYDVGPDGDGVLPKLETLFEDFDSPREMPAHVTRTRPEAAIADSFERANRNVEQTTGVGLSVLIPLLFVLLGTSVLIASTIRQRRVPLPDWYELFWFAFNSFIILNMPIPDDARRDLEPGESGRRAARG